MDIQENSRRWRYRAVKETLSSPELGRYLTYGIQAEEGADGPWTARGVIHDVAVSQQSAEAMAALFSRCRLSPLHFRDVVTDLLDSSVLTGKGCW